MKTAINPIATKPLRIVIFGNGNQSVGSPDSFVFMNISEGRNILCEFEAVSVSIDLTNKPDFALLNILSF